MCRIASPKATEFSRRRCEKAVAEGYKLAISVDCGIRAHEPLYWARDNGLDVIITDHHLPDEGEGVPPAYAVLNPNQKWLQLSGQESGRRRRRVQAG